MLVKEGKFYPLYSRCGYTGWALNYQILLENCELACKWVYAQGNSPWKYHFSNQGRGVLCKGFRFHKGKRLVGSNMSLTCHFWIGWLGSLELAKEIWTSDLSVFFRSCVDTQSPLKLSSDSSVESQTTRHSQSSSCFFADSHSLSRGGCSGFFFWKQ